MADKKISEFAETLDPALTGFIPVVDAGTNQKASLTTIFNKASSYIGLNAAELSEISTVVKSGSSNWGIDSDVRALTGDFDLASKTVFANASNWQDTYIQFQNNSPVWQDTSTVVQTNSSSWAVDNSVDTEVRSLTGKYEDVSTVVQTNSSSWAVDNSVDTELRGLSANWQDTSTVVQTNSAQWASNIDTEVRSLSSGWMDGNSAYTNLTTNSAAYLSAVDLSFLSVSGNWNSTYSTVQTNSANWNTAFSVANTLSADSVGTTWTLVPSAFYTTNWNDIAYGNGVFVASHLGSTTNPLVTANNNKLAISYDGYNWSSVTVPNSAVGSNGLLAYGNGVFVAMLQGNVVSFTTSYSLDGINWTRSLTNNNNSLSSLSPNSLVYGNGRFVATATVNGEESLSTCLVSLDGINWTRYNPLNLPTSYNTFNGTGLVFGNGKFFAINPTGADLNDIFISSSSDGINWVNETSRSNINTFINVINVIIFGKDKFIVRSDTSLYYSYDGLQWTQVPNLTVGNGSNIVYGNGTFILTNFNSNTTPSQILISKDGINWRTVNHQQTPRWRAIGYGNGVFTALLSGSGGMASGGIIDPQVTNSNIRQGDSILHGNYTVSGQISSTGAVFASEISTTGVVTASASNVRINVINSSTDRTFTDADNNRVVHIDTTTASLCAIFPNSLSDGFNVAIVNTGTNNLVLSSGQLNSAGTIIAVRYGGAFVYKDSGNLFAVGRLI